MISVKEILNLRDEFTILVCDTFDDEIITDSLLINKCLFYKNEFEIEKNKSCFSKPNTRRITIKKKLTDKHIYAAAFISASQNTNSKTSSMPEIELINKFNTSFGIILIVKTQLDLTEKNTIIVNNEIYRIKQFLHPSASNHDLIPIMVYPHICENEKIALNKKLHHPEQKVMCPRCGNEIVCEKRGNSIAVECKTPNCIYSGIRGL